MYCSETVRCRTTDLSIHMYIERILGSEIPARFTNVLDLHFKIKLTILWCSVTYNLAIETVSHQIFFILVGICKHVGKTNSLLVTLTFKFNCEAKNVKVH